MPVCHRFKNFQPQGLELRQLQFKQTQRRLHPQWHQIELHCKNTPRSGEKKKISFSPSPPWCLKIIKTPFFSSIAQLQGALLENKLRAEQMSFLSLPFQREGRAQLHIYSKTPHIHTQKNKNPKNSPVSPSPETQKWNQWIQHYNRAILRSQSRKEPLERAVAHSDRPGAGDRGWAMVSLILFAVCSKLNWQTRLEFAVKLHIFHVNIQGSCLSLGCVISCVALIIY